MNLVLSYVALVSKDVRAACAIFGDVLGLARTDVDIPGSGKSVPTFAVGEAALALFDPEHPLLGEDRKPGVHHIGLSPGDMASLAGVLAAAGLTTQDAGAGLQGKRRLGLDSAATVGVRTFLVEPLEIERSRSPLIERIDHLGIASADNQAAIDVFSRRMGVPVESQQTDMEVQTSIESFTSDKYGVVYHSRQPNVLGGLRVAFLTVGDCDLEFLQNFDPSHGVEIQQGASGNTRQDQGSITRYIERRGAGLHHFALKSPDINRTLDVLGRSGAKLIDRVGRPGSRRALIGFVHPDTLGGILFHVLQRD